MNVCPSTFFRTLEKRVVNQTWQHRHPLCPIYCPVYVKWPLSLLDQHQKGESFFDHLENWSLKKVRLIVKNLNRFEYGSHTPKAVPRSWGLFIIHKIEKGPSRFWPDFFRLEFWYKFEKNFHHIPDNRVQSKMPFSPSPGPPWPVIHFSCDRSHFVGGWRCAVCWISLCS